MRHAAEWPPLRARELNFRESFATRRTGARSRESITKRTRKWPNISSRKLPNRPRSNSNFDPLSFIIGLDLSLLGNHHSLCECAVDIARQRLKGVDGLW